MVSKKQKQELYDILKFTPVTVQVMIQGYGGESYAGKVDRKIYEYFKEHKIDLEEFASDYDDQFDFVPQEMRPFSPGSPYDCDNMWHASGAELDGTNVITISGPSGDIWEHNLDWNELEDAGVTVSESGGCDLDDDDIPDDKVIFNGGQGEKGCFFDGEFTLRAPFDPAKLTIHYENCGGWYLVTFVEYDGEEIDGSGGYSTTGKWAENKWILKGNEEVYDPISIEDWDPATELDKIVKDHGDDFLQEAADALNETFAEELNTTTKTPEEIMYGYTDWFDKEVKPARKGEYEVSIDAAWPMSGVIRAEWTGRTWKDLDGGKVKIKSWRGLASEPYQGE